MAKIYQTSKIPFHGRDYHSIYTQARQLYNLIQKTSRRRTYIRSAYFQKEKIFLDLFWSHLWQKNWHDRSRRLAYFGCGIDLLRHSRFEPECIENPNKKSELLYRFTGITPNHILFYVQIKEQKNNNQKFLLSIFPQK